MVVKHCCYGTCSSDNRKSGPEMDGVFFIPFVKPARQLEKCREWIKLCGRPHDRLNVELLGSKKGKNIYICSKHFVGGKGPTDEYPNPIPALSFGSIQPSATRARKAPNNRIRSSTPKKCLSSSTTNTNTSADDSTCCSSFFLYDHDYINPKVYHQDDSTMGMIDFTINLNEEIKINHENDRCDGGEIHVCCDVMEELISSIILNDEIQVVDCEIPINTAKSDILLDDGTLSKMDISVLSDISIRTDESTQMMHHSVQSDFLLLKKLLVIIILVCIGQVFPNLPY